MFFGYPVNATANNWLHECISEMILTIHRSLNARQVPPEWPDIIPETNRANIETRIGLRDRLDRYKTAVASLSTGERDQISRCLADQNRIAELLACSCDCELLDDLPEGARQHIRDLFGFGFQLLTSLGIRDRHYAAIYRQIPYRICPFCGCEYFDAPTAKREALDHYLVEEKYTFAAVNLRNLVPMGGKCNSRYKLAADIRKRRDNTYRRAFDPYNAPGVAISLDESVPFAGSGGIVPAWQIDFDLNSEEVETWDDVFSLRERLIRDEMNEDNFKSWLNEFSAWCRSARYTNTTDAGIIDAVERYADYQHTLGLKDRAFLKAATFRMLLRRCREGNRRLLNVMRDLIDERAIHTDAG